MSALHSRLHLVPMQYISRGRAELRQLGGFSGVGAIVPSFVPAECSGGGFLTDFKNYTHTPPPAGRNFCALDQKFIKHRKSAKTHRVGAL